MMTFDEFKKLKFEIKSDSVKGTLEELGYDDDFIYEYFYEEAENDNDLIQSVLDDLDEYCYEYLSVYVNQVKE